MYDANLPFPPHTIQTVIENAGRFYVSVRSLFSQLYLPAGRQVDAISFVTPLSKIGVSALANY